MGNRKEGAGMKTILFSTPMVQAILEGRKTQTRRVIKPQPRHPLLQVADGYHKGEWHEWLPEDKSDIVTGGRWGYQYLCPYCAGDILWVRETWGIPIKMAGEIIYKADYQDKKPPLADGQKWRPSIHMPKEAARIFLKVTDVRVERLQEISVQDAKDEGIKVWANGCIDGLAFGCYNGDKCVYNTCRQPIDYFCELWNSINSKRGYGWDSNPWVWVYQFVRVDKGETCT